MAPNWQDSLDRVNTLLAADDERVAPVCRSQFLSHDAPTPVAHVLLHGYTNAPPQFREIAQASFAAGANVLVPRVPHHGYSDPLTRELTKLTPEVLEAFCNEVVDAAAGLGDRIVVTGLSLGGLLASYIGKMRDEVAEVRLVAPFIQPKAVPEWVDAPFDAAMRALPDVYSWWNPKLREKEIAGTWATPKFSMKAIGAQIAFRRQIERTDAARTTRLDRVLLVVNAADIAVRNDVAARFVAEHLEPHAANFESIEIAKSLGFSHDLFEPNGDNFDRMDGVRDEVWPMLGLKPPAHGTLAAPAPGAGYYPELGRWPDSA
jgi:carboxylesterase